MSENVKIQITEVDNTTPAGNGIDSTDIAFIPGFSILPDAPVNKPTLVTSVREFEKLFGSAPRVLTAQDAAPYTDYGFKAGDFDRSYVYAKELLYQGMPVVYSNLAPEYVFTRCDIQTDDEVNVQRVSSSGETSSSSDVFSSIVEDDIINLDTLTPTIGAGDNYRVTVPLRYYIYGDNKSSIKLDAALKYTDNLNVDYPISVSNIVIERLENVDSTIFTGYDDGKHKISVTKISSNEIYFDSTYAADYEIRLIASVDFTCAVEPLRTVFVEFKQCRSIGSILDAFYKVNSSMKYPINYQWEIPSAETSLEYTIADKSIYSVKYITSGGYPSVVKNSEGGASPVFSSNMIAAAEYRGDAVALIDYQMDETLKVFDINPDSITRSFYSRIHENFKDLSNGEYGTMMYPWSVYNCGSTLTKAISETPAIEMPASFAYLMCVAKTIKTSPNWLAMAGVTRGIVPGIQKLLVPGNSISNFAAEEMQPKFGTENQKVSINTITNIRPYGLTLWGNRTLKSVSNEGTVALNFLNIRNMLSDIKKLLYTTAKSCMFEQDSDDLWLKFKDGIRPLLDRLKAGNGISDYKIVRGTTKYNGDPLTKGEIAAVIKIYPMYAVEYFELTVEINDQEVTVD